MNQASPGMGEAKVQGSIGRYLEVAQESRCQGRFPVTSIRVTHEILGNWGASNF
jgi:hypothetical protein